MTAIRCIETERVTWCINCNAHSDIMLQLSRLSVSSFVMIIATPCQWVLSFMDELMTTYPFSSNDSSISFAQCVSETTSISIFKRDISDNRFQNFPSLYSVRIFHVPMFIAMKSSGTPDWSMFCVIIGMCFQERVNQELSQGSLMVFFQSHRLTG